MKRMTDKELVEWAAKPVFPRRDPGSLRYAARLYHLDGKNALCKEWRRRAARLDALQAKGV